MSSWDVFSEYTSPDWSQAGPGPYQFISYKHLLMWFDRPITSADRFLTK